MKTYIPLKNRHLFMLSGEDTTHFLQGLISNDINKVTQEQSIYASMLTPQGKYLYDFFISLWQGNYILDVGTTNPESLLKKLKMYKLRSKVDIEYLGSNNQVVSLIGDDALNAISLNENPGHTTQMADTLYYTDPRTEKLGARVVMKTEALDSWIKEHSFNAGEFKEYEQLRMSLGIADGVADLKPEDSFPLQFGLEELNAIDFKKGCYVGQEVTARSKHRGAIKKAVFTIKGKAPLPEYGTSIMAGTSKIGEILSSSGDIGLALIRLDDWKKAKQAGIALSCSDRTVTLD